MREPIPHHPEQLLAHVGWVRHLAECLVGASADPDADPEDVAQQTMLVALEHEWERAAGLSAFGPVQRWEGALTALRSAGWPVQERSRWRLGELTVPWSAVAPL